ncbi:MAG TPA: hypothetical protein VEF34_20490 [Syntrophobacteraceae bacterium]|nr:hypothetical protein [Syntrophobacteraceae bacterium]
MFYASFAAATEEFTYVSKDRLKEELTNSDATLVDVRTLQSRDSLFKMRGAICEGPADIARWMVGYPKDKPIVQSCS